MWNHLLKIYIGNLFQLFTDDEIQVTADHLVRPILVPRDVHILPWFAGYAEAINAGKSLRNEDQVRTLLSFKSCFRSSYKALVMLLSFFVASQCSHRGQGAGVCG